MAGHFTELRFCKPRFLDTHSHTYMYMYTSSIHVHLFSNTVTLSLTHILGLPGTTEHTPTACPRLSSAPPQSLGTTLNNTHDPAAGATEVQ